MTNSLVRMLTSPCSRIHTAQAVVWGIAQVTALDDNSPALGGQSGATDDSPMLGGDRRHAPTISPTSLNWDECRVLSLTLWCWQIKPSFQEALNERAIIICPLGKFLPGGDYHYVLLRILNCEVVWYDGSNVELSVIAKGINVASHSPFPIQIKDAYYFSDFKNMHINER